jgi:RimJ/RimL family protein N-acetyltransferase
VETRLRGPLTPADVESVLDGVMSWVNDPEVTKNFARFDRVVTRDEERGFLARLYASPDDRVYAIEEAEGYAGQVGIHQIYWPARHGRLGIVIARRAWGRGHATRAIAEVCRRAFGELGLNKVWAIFYVTNARMRHICESLGFVEEGRLLEEYFHNGAFHDMTRMALLKSRR